jgi:hypothetical protein
MHLRLRLQAKSFGSVPSSLPSSVREAVGGEKGVMYRFMTHPPTLCSSCMGSFWSVMLAEGR